jgi:excisionase family DNA binding protein
MATEVSGGTQEGPLFVTVKVAAERLGLKTWDVYQLVARGELAHLPRGAGETIRIYAADLPRWAADQITKESA